MAQNYTRQSSFADGDTITAALFNNEFNQVVNAFSYSASSDSSTGHKHDGTAGQGGNIPQIGDIDFLNKIVVDNTNNRWGFYVQVSSGTVEQLRIQDGAIVPVTDDDIDLGTSSLEFKDLFLDGTAHIDTLDVDVNATVAGTLGVTGATTLSSTLGVTGATTLSSTLGVTGAITGSSTLQATTITATTAFVPDASDGASLGTSALEFSDLFLADGAVINFGADQDVSLTHVADTGLLLNSTMALQFNDASQYINAPSATVLDINATDEIELNATLVDVNANLDVSGTVTATGTSVFASLDISGDIDVNGTTNLDVVDIDGAVNIAAATTIATDNKIQFRDTAIYVNSSTDGQLDIVADTEVQIAATTVDINGAVDISGNLDVGGNLVVTGTTTFNGGTLTMGDAATDNVVFGADINSNIIPNTDDTYDLGSSSQEWRNLYIDGTANIDSLVADTADINGGTVDGVTIGGSSAGDITYANLSDGTITITAFVDEDDMSSDSATLVPTQQSVKAYVDSQVGTVDTLSEILTNGNTTGSTDIAVDSAQKVQFRDAAIYLNSSVDGQLDIVADTEIQIAATTVDLNGNLDVSGTALVAGVLTTTAATVFNGGFASNADSTLGTDKKVQFRDSAIYINSSADGQLDIVADTEIQIAATTVDLNGNLDVSGTVTASSTLTAQKLVSANGILELDDNGTHNGIINSPASLIINIDSDANSAGENFIIAKDRTSTSGGTELFRVQEDGNVGIGTASPSAKVNINTAVAGDGGASSATRNLLLLQTSGTQATAGTLKIDGLIHPSVYRINIDSSTGAGAAAPLSFSTANGATETMRIDASGNAGIGTSSPFFTAAGRTSLSVNGTSSSILAFGKGGSSENYILADAGGLTIANTSATLPTTFFNNASNSMTIDAAGNLLLNTAANAGGYKFRFNGVGAIGDTDSALKLGRLDADTTYLQATSDAGVAKAIAFFGASESMRIDASKNLLVGKTATAFGTAGVEASASNGLWSTRSGLPALALNRLSTDGSIADFYKDGGTAVGSIGTYSGDLWIGQGNTGLLFNDGGDVIRSANASGGNRDGVCDLGASDSRFKDLYLSGGVVFGTTGGAVSSKTLEDYEEGTWTPTLNMSSGSVSYTSQLGQYTKIGNQVTLTGWIYISGVSSPSGALNITVPFTASSTNTRPAAMIMANNTTGVTGNLGAWINPNTTDMYLQIVNNADLSSLDGSNMATNTEIYVTITYITT
jgi:fibronectin-binding autotransporter adhesin